MKLNGCRDYRIYLKNELERRLAVNPKYSMRAFARDLRVAPQVLSSVLSGRKAISITVAAKLAERLEMNPEESSRFSDLVLYAHTTDSAAKKIIEFRLNQKPTTQEAYQAIDVEVFKAISDWHHYAILELTQTQGFKSDPKWIARRLGISVHETQQALDRLKLLEMVEETDAGKLKRTQLNISASYGLPIVAVRKLNRQMLLKAADSIETQAMEERDITTMTMAIDPSRLPVAKKMISQFRRKITAYLEQGARTEVYTFVPALFRLTQKMDGKI